MLRVYYLCQCEIDKCPECNAHFKTVKRFFALREANSGRKVLSL